MTVIPLEPWKVYGDLCEDGDDLSQSGIDVCDIGVLPPAGCYLGTLSGAAGPIPVRFTVRPRPEGDPGHHRRVGYEVLGPGAPVAGAPLTMVFEAVQIGAP